MLDPAIDLAGPAHTMVSWLGTYFVHSTVLVGGVWMFTRFLPLDALTRSLLWKMSLVGGLFTATLQTGLGVEPLFGTVSVESGSATAAPASVPAPAPAPVVEVVAPPAASFVHACVGCEAHSSQVVIVGDEGVTIIASSGPRWVDHGVMWAVPPPPPPAAAPLAPPRIASASDAPDGGAVPWVFAGIFLLGAAASLGRLGVTVARLRQGLRDRMALRGPLRERLARLLAHARVPQDSVRLSMSERIGSPIALAGREIVVPERALELAPRQQEAMLAHELAHVVRRDPAWQVLASVIEAALFFQPLNRVARRGMQEAAEELCDDWAVRHTGSGVHLARCLTEVAGWPDRGDMSGDLASPMAGRRSLLVRRVERLLDERERERGRWARRWRGLLGAALLAMVGLGAPGLSIARAGSPTPPTPPTPPAPPVPPEPHAPPLAPEPMFTPGRLPQGSIAPVLAMAPQAGDANRLSRRQQRALRRLERLERRAEEVRSKNGIVIAPPPPPPEPSHESCSEGEGRRKMVRIERGPRPAVVGLDKEKLREYERVAAALAAGASHLDEGRLEAIEARAEALAAEIEASVEALHLDELGEQIERELGGLEGLSEQVQREVERALKHGERGRAREVERALREGKHEVEQALREAERERERAVAEAARGAEEARRALREAAAEGARGAEQAQRALERMRKPESERLKPNGPLRVRAGSAELQREVERALRDGTIDATETRRIQDAARRAKEQK